MSERASLAWCTGGGIAGEPVVELKELVRETGGGNSGEVLGYFGGGMGDPAGFTSTPDVDATKFSDNERGLPGRSGGTCRGTLWM